MISTVYAPVSYTGDGSTTVYDFPYPLFEESDLIVTVNGTVQTLNTDYTIVRNVSKKTDIFENATITFTTAPSLSALIFLVRRTALITQPKEGVYLPSNEGQHDRLLAQIQDLSANVLSSSQFVTPQDFGAQGDGETDDTQAINDALADGSPLYIPEGTYMIDAVSSDTNNTDGGISVPSGAKIVMHPEAILKAIPNDSNTYNVLRLTNVSNVYIEGGQIQGERDDHETGTGEHGMGLAIRGGSDISVKDTIISDCWGDGIYVGRDSVSTNIPTRIFMSGVISTGNRRNAFTPAAVHDGIFIGCQFNLSSGTAPQAGVDLEPAADSFTVKNIAFIGCQANDNAGRGFVIDDRPTSIIEGVIFDGCVASANESDGFISVQTRNGIVFNACQALNNGAAGFALSQATANAIRNCHASGNATYGISLGSSCIGCSMTGNFVVDNQYGIVLAEAGTDAPKQCVISGNNARLNGRHGIWIRLGSDNIIEGNIVSENSQETDATYDNIRLEAGATLNRVANNICRRGSETNQPAYGINMVNGASNIIEGNDLRTGGKTAAFRNVVSTTIHRGNILDSPTSFTSGDTTPSVAVGDTFLTANGSATTITTFDDGVTGQSIEVLVGDDNTTFDFSGTTLKGHGGVDYTAVSGDRLSCVFDGTNWVCLVSKVSNKITNSQLADVATATFKGRTTASTGSVEDLSVAQATALLNAVVGDSGSGGTKGLVPAPAAGDAATKKTLLADGTWGRGYLEATATVDPASVNTAAQTVPATITVTGAALGDLVQASFSLSLQGLILHAYVSAANTVTYSFANVTGGAVNLGSGTLKVRVYK